MLYNNNDNKINILPYTLTNIFKERYFVASSGSVYFTSSAPLAAAGLLPNDVVNFIKEALLMRDFNHLNVLPLLGIVYEPHDIDSLPLVVLPFMEKGDLKSLVSDDTYVSVSPQYFYWWSFCIPSRCTEGE